MKSFRPHAHFLVLVSWLVAVTGSIRSFQFHITERYVPFTTSLPDHTSIYHKWPREELRTKLPEYMSVVTTTEHKSSSKHMPNVLMGKPIHVVQNDRLDMSIANELLSTGLSIHFHGFEMPNAIQYDGVVGLTQCPISPGASFSYNFTVEESPGTYWYHTHSGIINIDSHNVLKAPIIVHPDTEESKLLVDRLHGLEFEERNTTVVDYRPLLAYDNERILFFSDGFLRSENIMMLYAIGGLNPPVQENDDGFVAATMEHQYGTINGKLREVIHVVRGNTYKLRLLNGGVHFSYRIRIDGFKFNVTATDSGPVEKFEADEVIIHGGERFDIEIKIPSSSKYGDRFWIRADTQEARKQGYENGIRAILHVVESLVDVDSIYDDAILDPDTSITKAEVPVEELITLNCYSDLEIMAAAANKKGSCFPITVLRYQNLYDTTRVKDNQIQHMQSFVHVVDFHVSPSPIHAHFTRIDNGNWYQFVGGKSNMLKHNFNVSHDMHPHSLMMNVPANSSGIIVWRSTSLMDHPMHLHGYKMEILEVKFADRKKDCTLFKCKLIDDFTSKSKIEELNQLKIGSRPMKDTFIMPAGGAVATRIFTHEPAPWLAHCHTEIHREDGMAFILNVGNYTSPSDDSWLPGDFPACDTNFLKSKYHEMPNCDCYIDEDAVLGLTLDQTYKCARPYLCIHIQSQVAALTQGMNQLGTKIQSSSVIPNWAISVIFVICVSLMSMIVVLLFKRFSTHIQLALVKNISERKRISIIDLQLKIEKPSFWEQFLNLTYIQWCEYRPGTINIVRLVEVAGVGMLAGILFQGVGNNNTATGLVEKTSLLFFSTTLWSSTRMYPAIGNYFEWSHKDVLTFKHKKYDMLPVFLSRMIVVILCESWWPVLFVFSSFPSASIFGNMNAVVQISLLLAMNNCCYIAIGAMCGTIMPSIHLAMIVSTLYAQMTVICAGFFTRIPRSIEPVRNISPIYHAFKGIVKLAYKWDDTYECIKGQSSAGPTQCFLEQSAVIDDYKERGINVATFGDRTSGQIYMEYVSLVALFIVFNMVVILYHLIKIKKTSSKQDDEKCISYADSHAEFQRKLKRLHRQSMFLQIVHEN